MPLTITVDTKSITDYLVQVGQRISDHAPLLDRIGQLMENRISDRFETRTDPAGAAGHRGPRARRRRIPRTRTAACLTATATCWMVEVILSAATRCLLGSIGITRPGMSSAPRRCPAAACCLMTPTPESLGAMTVSRSSSRSPTTSRPQRCSGPRACRACQLRRPLVAAPDA